MNRPVNAPCWVVYTIVNGEGANQGRAGSRFYVESPAAIEWLREHGKGRRFAHYDGYFTAQLVEPFLSEADAVAAAILVDGLIDKYEAGEKWPVSMKERSQQKSSAYDAGTTRRE